MYMLAAAICPDLFARLAAAVYGEMALAGITAVGEFHYLHHQADGRPYTDANAMGEALIEAAGLAGIRMTLLDTCYLRGGLDGRPLEGAQRRFGDGSAEAWARRVGLLHDRVGGSPTIRVGSAIHSVRAVDEWSISVVAEWAAETGAPLHFHLSEQQSENSDCIAATGMTPARVLAQAGALGPAATAIHGTHLGARDIELLGQAGAGVCLCPTTERDLGDGVGPSVRLAAAGIPLSLGSDSNSVIDLFEEVRAVELDDRLVSGRRGNHSPEALLGAATAGGMDALGWEGGTLEPGRLADFVALDLDSVRLAGWTPADLVAQVVFAATAADVRDVVVGGRLIVADRRHTLLGDVAELLRGAIAEAWTPPPSQGGGPRV